MTDSTELQLFHDEIQYCQFPGRDRDRDQILPPLFLDRQFFTGNPFRDGIHFAGENDGLNRSFRRNDDWCLGCLFVDSAVVQQGDPPAVFELGGHHFRRTVSFDLERQKFMPEQGKQVMDCRKPLFLSRR